MNNTVWKYPLDIDDSLLIDLPLDAEFLCVGVQDQNLVIWAHVNPVNPKQTRVVAICGTGHTRADIQGMRFLGSFQLDIGFVGHVFVDR